MSVPAASANPVNHILSRKRRQALSESIKYPTIPTSRETTKDAAVKTTILPVQAEIRFPVILVRCAR
jgi:hypothetical protein